MREHLGPGQPTGSDFFRQAATESARNPEYYRKQARVFTDLAAQCSSPVLADYYARMAQDYVTRAAQVEADVGLQPRTRASSLDC